jgi:PAS domain S-box-containing protein
MESNRADATLRATEARFRSVRFRSVVEDQTEVISRFLPDGTFAFVNEVYYRFFGKSAQELIGKKWQPVVVAEDLPEIRERLHTLSPSHPVVVIENRVYSGGGEVRWMQFVNRGFFSARGRLREVQSVGRDITERKQAEAASRELAAKSQSAREEERIRLAREIHDVLAQELTRMHVDLPVDHGWKV